jgi:hypothetical protein
MMKEHEDDNDRRPSLKYVNVFSIYGRYHVISSNYHCSIYKYRMPASANIPTIKASGPNFGNFPSPQLPHLMTSCEMPFASDRRTMKGVTVAHRDDFIYPKRQLQRFNIRTDTLDLYIDPQLPVGHEMKSAKTEPSIDSNRL